MPNPNYNDCIFINCPFDDEYMPLLYSIIYATYRCGFVPVCALGEDDGSDNRLDKIIRGIADCKYAIHDISRTEQNNNGLPRFNMPFELGVFFGAKKFGNEVHKGKIALIFERTKYLYQQYISDLNGIDTKAHNNDPATVIRKIRDWLVTSSKRTTIPGHVILLREYSEFSKKLPSIVRNAGLDLRNLLFNDFCAIVEEAVKQKLAT